MERGETNPLFSDNRLKLGIFATNVSSGCAITTAEEAYELNWPNTLSIAEIADRHGYEALVPVARWKGFGGKSNFNGTNFETYTWAAGLAQATKNIAVLTTSHVPTVHPIMAAKQATTVDHISNGRFALNVVCGWFRPELEMFGAPLMEHDMRYEYAAEWIDIVKMLWTRQEEFDYEGKFLRIKKGFAMPKPLQRPFPPLMNAGASGRGQQFAAKYADMAFIHIDANDLERTRGVVEAYRRLAREEHGREIQIWCGAPVTQRDTLKEAQEFVHYYVVEKGDDVAVDNLLRIQNVEMHKMLPESADRLRFAAKLGWGGYPLTGTADDIVAALLKLSQIGIDGVLVRWVDYWDGLRRWHKDVMPRLEQAGLRRAVRRQTVAAG
ncbi:MAG TPA: LLM class flavin-dependent oxidoreductase [Stellaceae bacterium]|nr:LLM class flavin-dependent oxidoreductase [Stellaceae bacterium]